MYKKFLTPIIITLVLCLSHTSYACVGRILYIGALQTSEDKIMSEILTLLINERTGTTIQTRYFDKVEDLYLALKSDKEEERVDILIEDTLDALMILKKESTNNPDKDLLVSKELYEKDYGVIWLNPLGYSNSKGETSKSISAPLVRRDVLTNFPLLPRVLNKLAGAITDSAYISLTKKVADGEKPKNAAKDFLKKKKLI